MGYTHYFYYKETPQVTWDKIVIDCKKLAANLPSDVKIDGCTKYESTPHFGDTEIWFNGITDHETFVLQQAGIPVESYQSNTDGLGFAFCKTAGKPYDLMVCACLLVYKHHSPDTMRLSSDGDASDWADAENFVKDTLGYTSTFTEHTK